jgi:hypothetical protein
MIRAFQAAQSCGVTNFYVPESCLQLGLPAEFSRERALLPTASSLFQTCNRAINQSGEQKGCFMKTKFSPLTNSMNRSFRTLVLAATLTFTLRVAGQVRPGEPTVSQAGGFPGASNVTGGDVATDALERGNCGNRERFARHCDRSLSFCHCEVESKQDRISRI